MADLTTRAIQRQLEAMGADTGARFELGIRHAARNTMIPRGPWGQAQIEAAAAWLRAQNAQGGDIYVRPAEGPDGRHEFVLLDDLPAGQLRRLERHGLPPAAVVETSPDNFQVWIRFDEAMDRPTRAAVARHLAQAAGGDMGSADGRHFGRLAGFTNRKPARALPDGRAPFVLVREASHAIVAPDARRRVVDAALQAAAERQPITPAPAPAPGQSDPGRLAQAVDAFQRIEAQIRRQYEGRIDQSRVDHRAAAALIKRGFGVAEVAHAIAAASPDIAQRKGARVADYAARTAARAAQAAQDRGIER